MRKIREILRLRAAGKSQHSVGIGQSTVGDYLTRARLAGARADIARRHSPRTSVVSTPTGGAQCRAW